MDREEVLRNLRDKDAQQKAAYIRELVVTNQLDIHDVVALAPDLSREGIGREPRTETDPIASANPNSAVYTTAEDPEEVHRGVWMFTSIALSGLAIAGIVAYLIAHHIAH